MNTPAPTAQRELLNLNKAVQMAGAVRELVALQNQKIVTAETDAKKAGLEKFLREAAYTHVNELVACFIAVNTEYEPFLQSVGLMLRRIGFVAQAQGQVEAPPAQDGEAKEEIVA